MARRSQDDRNARAQQRLRDLGLDPGPLKGAEYRLRRAQGIARGFSGAQAIGKPKVGERFISKPSVVQSRPRLRAQRHKGLGQQRVTSFGPLGRIVQTTDARFVRQQLRQAARAGEKVAARITATDGRGARTRAIEGAPDQRQRMADRVSAARGHKLRRESPQVTLLSKPQLTFSTSPDVFGQGEGFDPDLMRAWLDTYADDEDAWADMWDWAY